EVVDLVGVDRRGLPGAGAQTGQVLLVRLEVRWGPRPVRRRGDLLRPHRVRDRAEDRDQRGEAQETDSEDPRRSARASLDRARPISGAHGVASSLEGSMSQPGTWGPVVVQWTHGIEVRTNLSLRVTTGGSAGRP